MKLEQHLRHVQHQQLVQVGVHVLQAEHKQEHVHISMEEAHTMTQVIQHHRAVHIVTQVRVLL